MPFDGATFRFSAQDTLDQTMSASGLHAIDPYRLYCHKAEQIRRHPPGWAYRHQQTLALAQVAVLLASVVLFVILLSVHEVPWGLVVGMALFALGSSLMFVPVKGPAYWRERPIDDLSEIPAPIRRAAQTLQHREPRIGFLIGELYQERIKLDPYLVAECAGGRVVLGIWDGDRVIACA